MAVVEIEQQNKKGFLVFFEALRRKLAAESMKQQVVQVKAETGDQIKKPKSAGTEAKPIEPPATNQPKPDSKSAQDKLEIPPKVYETIKQTDGFPRNTADAVVGYVQKGDIEPAKAYRLLTLLATHGNEQEAKAILAQAETIFKQVPTIEAQAEVAQDVDEYLRVAKGKNKAPTPVQKEVQKYNQEKLNSFSQEFGGGGAGIGGEPIGDEINNNPDTVGRYLHADVPTQPEVDHVVRQHLQKPTAERDSVAGVQELVQELEQLQTVPGYNTDTPARDELISYLDSARGYIIEETVEARPEMAEILGTTAPNHTEVLRVTADFIGEHPIDVPTTREVHEFAQEIQQAVENNRIPQAEAEPLLVATENHVIQTERGQDPLLHIIVQTDHINDVETVKVVADWVMEHDGVDRYTGANSVELRQALGQVPSHPPEAEALREQIKDANDVLWIIDGDLPQTPEAMDILTHWAAEPKAERQLGRSADFRQFARNETAQLSPGRRGMVEQDLRRYDKRTNFHYQQREMTRLGIEANDLGELLGVTEIEHPQLVQELYGFVTQTPELNRQVRNPADMVKKLAENMGALATQTTDPTLADEALMIRENIMANQGIKTAEQMNVDAELQPQEHALRPEWQEEQQLHQVHQSIKEIEVIIGEKTEASIRSDVDEEAAKRRWNNEKKEEVIAARMEKQNREDKILRSLRQFDQKETAFNTLQAQAQNDPDKKKKLIKNVSQLYSEESIRDLHESLLKAQSEGLIEYQDIERFGDFFGHTENRNRYIAQIHYSEIIDISRERIERLPTEIFQSRSLNQEELGNLALGGHKAEDEWFFTFIKNKESQLRQQFQLQITDWQKVEEFFSFLDWKYGVEDSLIRRRFYMRILDMRPAFHARARVVLFETPGDEDLLKILTVTPDELMYLIDEPEANYAISLYEQAVRNVMRRKMERYIQLRDGDQTSGVMSADNRKKTIKVFSERLNDGDVLSAAEMSLYYRLLQEKTEMDMGVMLWDTDIGVDENLMARLRSRDLKVQSLKNKLTNESLSLGERQRILVDLEEAQLTEYEKKLLKNEGKSPIDIEVESMLRFHLKHVLGRDVSDIDIYRAIYAARNYHLLTLNIVQISSMMAEIPTVTSTKSVMRAPAFERLQRIINPELFMRRFNWGDQRGQETLALMLMENMEQKGITIHKHQGHSPDAMLVAAFHKWEHDLKQKGIEAKKEDFEFRYRNPIVLEAEALAHAAQQVKGLEFPELIRGGTTLVGGLFQQSTWRAVLGMQDPMIEYMRATGRTPEHQALALQLAAKDPLNRGKENILLEMTERNLSVFIQLDAQMFTRVVRNHPGVDKGILEKAVTLAELQLSHNDAFRGKKVDIAGADFDTVVKPILLKMAEDAQQQTDVHTPLHQRSDMIDWEAAKRLTDPVMIGQYRDALREIQTEARVKVGNEEFSKHPMPLTLSMADIDMKQVNLEQMGNIAGDRRTKGDMVDAYQINQFLYKFVGDHEVIFPEHPAEQLKLIKEAKMHEESINGKFNEGNVGGSEQLGAMAVSVTLAMNLWEERRSALRWIPGARFWMPRLHYFRANDHTSRAQKYGGQLANMWDEREARKYLFQAEETVDFAKNPELLEELFKKYHVTTTDTVVGLIADFWWLGPVGIIGLLIKDTLDNAGKEGGGAPSHSGGHGH